MALQPDEARPNPNEPERITPPAPTDKPVARADSEVPVVAATKAESPAKSVDSEPTANASSPTEAPTPMVGSDSTAVPIASGVEATPQLSGDPAAYHHDEYHSHHGEHHDPYHDHGSQHYEYPEQHPPSTDYVPPTSGYTSEASTPNEVEEGGGPVKSFLEHLEDFRWLLIKCTGGIAVTMVVCLLAVNYVVAVLEWPLKRAANFSTDTRQYISVKFGPKELLNFRADTNHAVGFLLSTNRYIELELVPLVTGSNQVLVLQVRTNSDQVPPEESKKIVYLTPAGPFLNSLHLAFFAGILIAAPFVFYHIAQFLLPALKPREKTYFLKALTPAVLLFVGGVCMCYFLILPLALRATEQYSLWMGVEMPFWEAEAYFGFCTKFMLGMGLGFEMPVILLALVKIGLLNYRLLAGFRRHMIVINLVLGALLTTPEVITQVAMFVPLQMLYEITIWIAWYWEQEDRAYARRRAILALFALAAIVVLVWAGVQYGWPWLRAQIGR